MFISGADFPHKVDIYFSNIEVFFKYMDLERIRAIGL